MIPEALAWGFQIDALSEATIPADRKHMAKANEPAPISRETIEILESQVKKGKARKFFLITKGSVIMTLVVFRKGPFGPKIMQAKKSGFQGEVTYGVVSGSGQKLFFSLAGNLEVAAAMKIDSFAEEQPVKTAKFRDFLNGSGLKFKPSFHIIHDVAVAPDPDNESDIPVAPPLGAQSQDESLDEAGQAADAETASDSADLASRPDSAADPAIDFAHRLKALKPDIATVVKGNVSSSEKVKLAVSEAATCAKQRDFARALTLLDELEPAVKRGLLELDGSADASSKFTNRLRALLPGIKSAMESSVGPQAKALAGEARDAAASGDYVVANSRLDDAESLINKIQPSGNFPSNELSEKLKQMKPLLAKALKLHVERRDELHGQFAELISEFKAGKFEAVAASLSEFEYQLLQLTAVDPAGKTGDPTQMERFAESRQSLEPLFLQASRAHPDRASKLLQVWEYAQNQADKGNLGVAGKAIVALRETVDQLLENVPGSDAQRYGIEDGIVADRRKSLQEFFRQRIESAKQNTATGVQQLTGILSEQIVQAEQLVASVNAELAEVYDAIYERLEVALQSESREEVAKALAACQETVAVNPLVQATQASKASTGIEPGVLAQFEELFKDVGSKLEEIVA